MTTDTLQAEGVALPVQNGRSQISAENGEQQTPLNIVVVGAGIGGLVSVCLLCVLSLSQNN